MGPQDKFFLYSPAKKNSMQHELSHSTEKKNVIHALPSPPPPFPYLDRYNVDQSENIDITQK